MALTSVMLLLSEAHICFNLVTKPTEGMLKKIFAKLFSLNNTNSLKTQIVPLNIRTFATC